MSARLYDRPDLDQRRAGLALYVTGTLPNARPGLAYEGRLAIHNAIGACTVEQIDGDTLPPGSSLYIDGDEVVIAWPAYTETSAPIFNGDFEQGDVGWLKGAGWTIENSGGGNSGFGAKVAVYRGQGESFLEAAAYFPAQPQQFVARVNVQQGASSAGNVGAGIGVRYYDADHQLVATQLGSFIDSGSGGAWHMSTGNFSVPANATYARPIVRGYRRRENKPLWVDDASWEYQAILGINAEVTFSLTLRVRDSAGRSAVWSGEYDISVWDGSWTDIPYNSTSLSWRGVANAIFYNGAVRLLIGGHDGHVWHSDDRGVTWTDTTSPLNSTAYYTRSFDYNDRDDVLVCCGHYVARSLDGGATWVRTYTPYDSAWQCVRWIPQWNIFIVVGAGSYTRRILTLDAAGESPSNKSNTGNYNNVVFIPQFNRAICLPSGSSSYAVCSDDPTATEWEYRTAPENIFGARGFAVLPNGDLWVCSYGGYMISKDGGYTFLSPIAPNALLGVSGVNMPGFIVYDESLNILVIQPHSSGSGASSSRQFISKDNGVTFEPTDDPAPLAGTTMATCEGVNWSASVGCFIGTNADNGPNIYFSNTGRLG